MMMFGGRTIPEVAFPAPVFPGRAGATAPIQTNLDAPATEQLIADGWGFATINPTSIQADNGAGLTKGVIGLVNKGQPRKPEDWGAWRAWGWALHAGSIISKPTKPSMRSRSGSKAFPGTAKPRL